MQYKCNINMQYKYNTYIHINTNTDIIYIINYIIYLLARKYIENT